MSIYNLGRVVPIFKGDYNNNTEYKYLDVVRYNGSSYVVVKDSTTGNLPTNTEFWAMVAQAGTLSPEQIADIEQQIIDYVQSQGYVIDSNYVHTDNNFTTADKNKLEGIDMTTKQDTLISGSNIKSINNQSILGSGNVNLATPEQLNTKQDTLVSGSNIKTINNESLLGSGNIDLIDNTKLINPPTNTAANSIDVLGIKNYTCDNNFYTEKLQPLIYQGITSVNGNTGLIQTSSAPTVSCEVEVGNFDSFRFSGIIKNSLNTNYSAGWAFGYYTNGDTSTQDNWNTITSYFYDSDVELDGVYEKEYVIKVPKLQSQSITHFRCTHFTGVVPNFYIYGQKGETIEDKIKDTNDYKELFIGSLIQKSINATGDSDNNAENRVSMKSVIAVPYLGVELKVEKMPSGYFVGVRHGDTANNLSLNYYWFKEGDTVKLTNTTTNVESRYYRLSFGKVRKTSESNWTGQIPIPLSEVEELVNNGSIKLVYKSKSDIVSDNISEERYIFSSTRKFFSDATLNNTLPNIPVFAHTSDIHGDATRFDRFLKYCDYLNVDAALITGDYAAYSSNNGCYYINDISDKYITPVLPCTGNHDVRNLYTAQEQNEAVVGYLMTKNNVSVNPLEGDYPTYYYKDFPTKNIRVISLNIHELQRAQTDGCNFTQIQAEWFVNTLLSTPQDYGVLVLYHEPEAHVLEDNNYNTFYQPNTTIEIFQSGITGAPISHIIDAFISKTQTTISYTTQGVSVSLPVDFSNVNTGVEFIAHVCGHEHVDWIGSISGRTNRQLILDITCGVGIYGNQYPYLANISDIARNRDNSLQDAFNIYSIDRANKCVRVARVGSNITAELKERKYMIIPYAVI